MVENNNYDVVSVTEGDVSLIEGDVSLIEGDVPNYLHPTTSR